MSMKKKFEIGTLLLAMLLVCIVFVPAVSAQENSIKSDKPSQLEQGLIDALNSNTNNLATDDVVANYCKSNKEKIPILTNETFSAKNKLSLKTYGLKDGSNVTFTNKGFFYISSIKEEQNNIKINQKTTSSKSLVTPQYYELSYTPLIKAEASFYNMWGSRLFTIDARGYYGYNVNPAICYGYLDDAWYTRGTASPWQVSNWVSGSTNYNSNTGQKATVYAKGNFHWGAEYQGVGFIVQDYYIKVYSNCYQFGNYHYPIVDMY